MAELKEVMTPKQVADYLQMHPMTIYRYIHQGKLGAAKIGARYRIKRENVEKLLEEINAEGEEQ